MGILDDLKSKVEKLGDRAREGFDDAKDKAGDLLGDAKDRAGDLVDDAKERLGQHDDERSPLTESSDVGADSSSTDAVQPGYVTAEDDATEDSDESSLEAEAELDAEDDPDAIENGAIENGAIESGTIESGATESDVVPPAAAELDPVDLDAQETHADEAVEPVGADVSAPAPAAGPLVEKDVDPYEQPLTETIGEELANALAAQRAGETDLDASR
ncbi:MAG: hypothetical protein ACRYG2_23100 [Janthinobacterium lividum]